MKGDLASGKRWWSLGCTLITILFRWYRLNLWEIYLLFPGWGRATVCGSASTCEWREDIPNYYWYSLLLSPKKGSNLIEIAFPKLLVQRLIWSWLWLGVCWIPVWNYRKLHLTFSFRLRWSVWGWPGKCSGISVFNWFKNHSSCFKNIT